MSYALDAQRRVKMSSNDAESDLISKAVAGDLAALELLLFRHRKRLTAYVQARFPPELRDSLEPLDIVQDTWLRAIRAIATFRPVEFDQFHRWLVTIARHVIADQLKRYVPASPRSDEAFGFKPIKPTRAHRSSGCWESWPSISALRANPPLITNWWRHWTARSASCPATRPRPCAWRFLNGDDIKAIAAKMNRLAEATSQCFATSAAEIAAVGNAIGVRVYLETVIDETKVSDLLEEVIARHACRGERLSDFAQIMRRSSGSHAPIFASELCALDAIHRGGYSGAEGRPSIRQSNPQPMLFASPSYRIPGYLIEREISSGGQATVFKALQERIGRAVAVKIIHGGPFVGTHGRKRFDRESEILARLNHPNIVSILDRGRTADGSFYLVMDFVEGATLDAYLRDLGKERRIYCAIVHQDRSRAIEEGAINRTSSIACDPQADEHPRRPPRQSLTCLDFWNGETARRFRGHSRRRARSHCADPHRAGARLAPLVQPRAVHREVRCRRWAKRRLRPWRDALFRARRGISISGSPAILARW